ncbi:MAG: Maf-like protein [Rhodobacteraceae bacterium]|nr:Maf-like protein [Paracoccaceae bacterium]
MTPVILASSSPTRLALLLAAGLHVHAMSPRVDEPALRASLDAERISPRDMADALAEAKAQKIGLRNAEALVLGCDQVLEFKGQALAKPESPAALEEQLRQLRGQSHKLHSAGVIHQDGRPVWRAVTTAELWMRNLPDDAITAYVSRNWAAVQGCVGGYRIEGEGIRLFHRIEGDHFTILGLPLLPLLNFLHDRKELP